jgi:hypothetical protein
VGFVDNNKFPVHLPQAGQDIGALKGKIRWAGDEDSLGEASELEFPE